MFEIIEVTSPNTPMATFVEQRNDAGKGWGRSGSGVHFANGAHEI